MMLQKKQKKRLFLPNLPSRDALRTPVPSGRTPAQNRQTSDLGSDARKKTPAKKFAIQADACDRVVRSPNPGGRRWLSSPLQIGCNSPGTEPDHIPYHLYLLVKEAVDIMKRSEWHKNFNDLEQSKASSLIAGYDTIFPKDGPRYDMSGFTPLGDQVEDFFDWKNQLSTGGIVKLMSIVHSRKTPAPETFMEWSSHRILFYCKLCSCFGIDYQNLESASEDDVCLMNMGF
ncbi:hypothetical protein R6Q59_018769 [Mikania micrantha]